MTKEKKKTLTLKIAKKPTCAVKSRLSGKKIYIPIKSEPSFESRGNKSARAPYAIKKQSSNKHKLALRKLEKEFPKVFNLGNPRPLEQGIREQLLTMEKDVSNKSVRLGLFFYCNSHQYLRSVVEGVCRVNAKGRYTKKVTKEEENEAKERLRRLFTSLKKKRN